VLLLLEAEEEVEEGGRRRVGRSGSGLDGSRRRLDDAGRRLIGATDVKEELDEVGGRSGENLTLPPRLDDATTTFLLDG